MKRSRFSEEQIIGILKKLRAEVCAKKPCRRSCSAVPRFILDNMQDIAGLGIRNSPNTETAENTDARRW